MGRKKAEIDLNQIIYCKNPAVQFRVQDNIVTIVRPQNHWIQRGLRKLHFRIPAESDLELDAYGSFVFKQINGHKSAYQIGQALSRQFDEANDYLYERLLVYLNHLAETEHLIQLVK